MVSRPPENKDTGHDQRVRGILVLVEQERAEAQQESNHFTAMTEQQLRASGNKPVIAWQSWPSTVRESLTYLAGIANPTGEQKESLFVQVFARLLFHRPGAQEHRAQTSEVDSRFGSLVLPHYPGLALGPGSVAKLAFSLPVRAVERGSYPGNAILFSSDWHNPAIMLDTANFLFQVTP